MSSGGRCDFDDGGSYTGAWHDGMSHGYGVCTGPMGQGEYAGSWQFGFEVSGVYTWTSGNYFEGQWLQGKRHGLGVERKGHWLYRGEWTQGFKGRYGIRQSTATGLKFEGTWTAGLQDGYGVETYADGGTYQGQWLRGLRHGYGIRESVSYDLASRYQAGALPSSTLTLAGNERDEEIALLDRDRRTEENRGGFVLLSKTTPSEDPNKKKRLVLDKHGRPSIRKTIANELRLIRQKSTGDIQEPLRPGSRQSGGSVRSTVSTITQSSATSGRTTTSVYTDEDAGSFVSQTDLEQGGNVVEKYFGEWKNDKRSGYGICERSDGLKYEGEWYNNKKYGYGVTTFRDGSRLEGKYKNNVLVNTGRTSKLLILRSTKVRDRVESAVIAAHRAADIARQKADIAISRMTSARVKCEQAEDAAKTAVADAEQAKAKAREYSPNSSRQSDVKIIANRLQEEELSAEFAQIDANAEPQALQGPQSAKKFSFFKFKKDASLRQRGDTLLRPPEPPVTQSLQISITTSASPTNAPTHTVMPQTLPNSLHRTHAPAQSNVRIGNDLRVVQQSGFHGGFDSGAVQVAHDRRQPLPFDRVQTFADHSLGRQFTQGPQTSPNAGFAPNAGFSQPTMQFHAMDPTVHDAMSPQRNMFDDSYNWAGYADGGLRERRKSLPSIVKDKKEVPASESAKWAAQNHPQTPTGVPDSPYSLAVVDTYVIEDGVRKKVKSLFADNPVSRAVTLTQADTRRLPKKLYELEATKTYRKGEMGSMPDVSAVKDADILPREAVYVMSQQRREALMRERAEEERRRRNQIVFRLGDLKDWCANRQVLVFILALNISLATVFYNLLQ